MDEKVKQVLIESKYSKKGIQAIVLEDIGELKMQIELDLIKEIHEFISTSEFKDSEQFRKLRAMDIRQVAEDICLTVLPVEKWTPIQGIATKLAFKLNHTNIFNAVNIAGELIAVACKVRLCNLQKTEKGLDVVSLYKLEPQTKHFIEGTKYLPPMICEPLLIRKNNDSAYLTIDQDSVLLHNQYHNFRLNLSVLNNCNKIELTLDEEVLAEIEEPTKVLNTYRKKYNHDLMVLSSNIVYDELINAGNKFYLTHKFDTRGRLYCQGYHVNYQGSPYKRASISLANKELATS